MARASERASSAPTTLGMVLVLWLLLPGSSRSGEKARNTSSPTLQPPASRIGCTTSRVVPGQVVDSSTTSWPGRSALPMAVAVSST